MPSRSLQQTINLKVSDMPPRVVRLFYRFTGLSSPRKHAVAGGFDGIY